MNDGESVKAYNKKNIIQVNHFYMLSAYSRAGVLGLSLRLIIPRYLSLDTTTQ